MELLKYFGEEITDNCGICSTCLNTRKEKPKDRLKHIKTNYYRKFNFRA